MIIGSLKSFSSPPTRSGRLLVGTLLLLLLFSLVISCSAKRDVSVRHRRGGGLELIVNVNVNGKRSSPFSSSKSAEESTPATNSQQEESSFVSSSEESNKQEITPQENTSQEIPLDKTTQEIASQVHDVVSKKMATEVAENLLKFAGEVKKIYDAIPNSGLTQEQQEFKTQLLAMIRDFTSKASNPSAEFMVSSLKYLNAAKKLSPPSVNLETNDDNKKEAKTLFILPAIGIVSDVMNFVDGIGTYSSSISKEGKWLEDLASEKLQKWGFQRAANAAKSIGTSISNFSEKKLGRIEERVAKKIAPFVKSKSYLALKRSINLVASETGLHGVAKSIGSLIPAKLPRNFKELKSTLTNITKLVKDRRAIMQGIRNAAKGLKTSLISKLRTARSTRSAIRDVKSGMELLKRKRSSQRRRQQRSAAVRGSGTSSSRRQGNSSNRRVNRRQAKGNNRNGARSNGRRLPTSRQRSTSSSSNGRSSGMRRSSSNNRSSNNRRRSSSSPKRG